MRWRWPFQFLIVAIIRPYTVREFPGWGLLSRLYDHRWDWLWADEPRRVIRDKLHGNLMELNLAFWWDRNNYFLGRWYDLEIQLVTKSIVQEGDTVVDVGANRGEFTLAASKLVGSSGRVISFEPNPSVAASLLHHVAINGRQNVILHPVGLGDEPGTSPLNVPVGFSYYGTFGKPPSDTFDTIHAAVAVGDDLLENEAPTLIKIDVEGFEARVLRGLRKTLEKHRPVVITEFIDKNLRACGSSCEDVRDFMEPLGYRAYKLGLQRSGRKHVWTAAPIAAEDYSLDAIWFPTGANDAPRSVMEMAGPPSLPGVNRNESAG